MPGSGTGLGPRDTILKRISITAMVSDANKAFIQAFLARRILTLEEAKPILTGILNGNLLNPHTSLYTCVPPSTKIFPSLWPTKSHRQ